MLSQVGERTLPSEINSLDGQLLKGQIVLQVLSAEDVTKAPKAGGGSAKHRCPVLPSNSCCFSLADPCSDSETEVCPVAQGQLGTFMLTVICKQSENAPLRLVADCGNLLAEVLAIHKPDYVK